MGIIEAFARPVATPDARLGTPASPSPSITTAQSGIAGTAASPATSAATIDPRVLAWAADRGLSAATLARLPVASATAVFFPDSRERQVAIRFGYGSKFKSRSIDSKSFVADKGIELQFWNLPAVLAANPDCVFITEGELDAAALVEAGVSADQVLSVPNGAKERPADAPAELRGYGYVQDALRAGLNRVRQIVWCGDADGPGLALRADMVRLFGAARFAFVDWPEGAKDANDLLLAEGPAGLSEHIATAKAWPVEGLYRMSELPEPAPLTLWHPGFDEWESKVRLAPRTLSVVTGHPGHGKTALWQQIWFQVVRKYGVTACMASFETRAKPHIRRQLRTLLSGVLEKDMTDDERRKADAWIDERYLFVSHPEQRPTLAWLLDMAEVAVIRHGARIISVDPWNRLEGSRTRDESETDYIGRCLRSLHAFAHDLNCHVQILAHPAKMDSGRRGQAPGLEDISGSKNWENMVDQGFVVHRPEIFDGVKRKTEATLFHRKARFDELGYPCKLGLDYSIERGSYRSTDYDTAVYGGGR